MFEHRRKTIITMAALLALLVAAALPLTALADDSAPPEVPAAEEVLPTEVPAAEEVLPPEVPAVEEVLPTEVPAAEEMLLAEETALASEEAAAALFTGDPMWCPVSVLPGGAGCTAAWGNFTGLYNDLNSNPGTYFGNGTIYVAWDYDVATAGDGPDIALDWMGNGLGDLVFQGGWNFTTNTPDATQPWTVFDGANVQFWNWGANGSLANLTINDIDIINAGDYALVVATDTATYTLGEANVALNGVWVEYSTAGAYIHTDGDVDVSDSVFNDSAGGSWSAGLEIYTPNGNVTLDGVDAVNNQDDGIDILTDGNVTLTDVVASDNDYDGVYIAGYNDWYANIVTVNGGTFTVNGDGSHPAEYGLNVYACQLNLDGEQEFYGNDSFFEQDPACCTGGGEGGREKKQVAAAAAVPQVVAKITACTEDDLPADLAEDQTFRMCKNVELLLNGVSIEEAPDVAQVAFDIPAGMEGETFTVLFWDGAQWVEVPSSVVDGQVVFTVKQPGLYILVTQ